MVNAADFELYNYGDEHSPIPAWGIGFVSAQIGFQMPLSASLRHADWSGTSSVAFCHGLTRAETSDFSGP